MANTLQPIQDSSFFLNIKHTTLRSTILEPLSLVDRLRMEDYYQLCEQVFDPELYRYCRLLRWNEQQMTLLVSYHQAKTLPPNLPPQQLEMMINTKLIMNFFNFCSYMAPVLERMTLENQQFLPVDPSLPPNSEHNLWLTTMCSLRSLTIDVVSIDPVLYQFPWDLVVDREPLLSLLNNPGRTLRACRNQLRTLHLVIKNVNFARFGKTPLIVFQFINHFAHTLESICSPLWAVSAQEFYAFRPFPALQAYSVQLSDVPLATDPPRFGSTELLIDWWEQWEEYFAPPQQIRKLNLTWYGTARMDTLHRLIAVQLRKYTNLHRIAIALAFKVTQGEFELRTMTQTVENIKQELITQEYHWPYRSLWLIFPNETLYTSRDPFPLQPNESFLQISSDYHRCFVGENATNLRQLWLSITEQTMPLTIDAPNIEMIGINFQHWRLFPLYTEREVFRQFSHPETVQELHFKNFYQISSGMVWTAEQIQKMATRYYAYLCPLIQLFPNLKRLHLCSNEKVAPFVPGSPQTISTIERFYLRFSMVVVLLVIKLTVFKQQQQQKTNLCEVHLVDHHPKLCSMVVDLLNVFIELANDNPNRFYLLSLPYDQELLDVIPPKEGEEESQQQLPEQSTPTENETIYKKLIEKADSLRNLRLLVPNVVRKVRMTV